MHPRRSFLALGLVLAFAPAPAPAASQTIQERVDLSVVARIRDEALNRSLIPELAGSLTDVIGPRLTGSGGMRQANDWTAEQFRSWGLANVTVEPWGKFGRGWERVSYSGRMLAPYVQPLNGQPLAWSGSTRGTVTGPAVILVIADTADFPKYRGKLRGAFVLRDSVAILPPEFDPRPLRTPLDQLFDTTSAPRFTPPPPPPSSGRASRRSRRSTGRSTTFCAPNARPPCSRFPIAPTACSRRRAARTRRRCGSIRSPTRSPRCSSPASSTARSTGT